MQQYKIYIYPYNIYLCIIIPLYRYIINTFEVNIRDLHTKNAFYAFKIYDRNVINPYFMRFNPIVQCNKSYYLLNRQNTIYNTGCISTTEINKLSARTPGICNPITTKAPIRANRHII